MTILEVSDQILPCRGRPHQPQEYQGRGQDLAVIRAFVDELPARGAALLLSGDNGTGKSALLNAAEEIAITADIRVLRAAGAEFEDVSFFGLNQLLLPIRGDLSRLDELPRRALNVALGFSDGPARDRLMVSNAALALLGQIAADRPLLLIIDDWQWMDQASALILGFVARRLRGSQIGFIAAQRTGASLPLTLDVPRFEVRPLGDDVPLRLVTDDLPDLVPAVRPGPGRPRSGDDAGQARELATAAYRAASTTGDLGAAEALLADIRRSGPGLGPSAETALATAVVLLHGDGDVATAHRLLMRAIATADAAGAGPLSAAEALGMLIAVCRVSSRAEHWESLERFIARSGSAFPASMHGVVRHALNPRATLDQLASEIDSLADQAEPAQIVRTASASAFADRLPDCRQALRRVARLEAAVASTPGMQASILLALEAYQTGQWDEAWRLAEYAAVQSASRGYQLLRQQARTVLAFVAAGRGDVEAAREITDEIARWAAPRGIISLQAGAHYANMLAALAQSNFPAAYQQAAAIRPAGDVPAREPLAAWALLDLVEAALRTGRCREADAHVQAVRRAGLAATSPRMALLSTAAMAMIAPDEEALTLFELALASMEAERWPFERARVHLLFGERLRRAREVTAARVHLGAAHDEFRRLGAQTWADRAAMELRAAGEIRPRAESCDHQVLTPQELQIARLAAAGLSNKEIGGRLFMSHRTVASHLYRMFPKLGITSRAALGRALPREVIA